MYGGQTDGATGKWVVGKYDVSTSKHIFSMKVGIGNEGSRLVYL